MAKRNWDKALYDKYELVSSPSQLASYLDCPRKWWFKSVCRLKEPPDQKKFVFGTVLHEVIERWLQSSEQKPVEIFPDGWDAGLDAIESASLRKLVTKGIADGTIRRLPHKQVEAEYVREVSPAIASIGALDVGSPEGVEDHKSSKSKNYVATQKELANDPKMLCYAYEWLQGHPNARAVKLRLNYFIKDPDNLSTKVVEVMVPSESVQEFWKNTFVPAHEGMLLLKRANKPPEKWREITGPQSKDTCRKYGGCPYAKICGGCQSPQSYKKEIDRMNAIFKRKQPAEAASAPANVPPPVLEDKPTQVGAIAPWAVPECHACKGTGINKKGEPCRACDSMRSRRGEATSGEFNARIEGDRLVWDDDGAAPIVSEVETKPTKPVKKVEPKAKTAPAPEPEPEAEPKLDPRRVSMKKETEVASEPTEILVEVAGFTLFVNAVPLKGEFVDLADVLAEEGQKLAVEWEVESFYQLDAFKRRDALATAAPEIAKDLAGKRVVALGGGQDLKALVDALRPFAVEVIHGTF